MLLVKWPAGEDVVVVERAVKRTIQVPGDPDTQAAMDPPHPLDHLGTHPVLMDVDDFDYYVVASPLANGAPQLFHGAAELQAHMDEIERVKAEGSVKAELATEAAAGDPPAIPPPPASK